MDLVLHLGAHRTGTTTLQRTLEQNAATLANAGTAAWTPVRTRAGLFTGLIHRPDILGPEQIRRGDRARGLISIEMARLAGIGRRALIVSEENISGSIRQNLGAERLYPDFADRLARVRSAFSCPVRRIGIAVRAYDGWWSSALAFDVANGAALPTRDRLDRLTTQPRRWRDLIRAAAIAAPEAEIIVWPFERFASAPGAAIDLLTGGSFGPILAASEWSNRSLKLDQLRKLVHRSDARPCQVSLPPGDGRWMPFDADQQAVLRAEYRQDLAWLRDGADGIATYHDTHPIFSGRVQQKDQQKTATEVSGAVAAKFVHAMTRSTTRGQNYGEQGYMA